MQLHDAVEQLQRLNQATSRILKRLSNKVQVIENVQKVVQLVVSIEVRQKSPYLVQTDMRDERLELHIALKHLICRAPLGFMERFWPQQGELTWLDRRYLKKQPLHEFVHLGDESRVVGEDSQMEPMGMTAHKHKGRPDASSRSLISVLIVPHQNHDIVHHLSEDREHKLQKRELVLDGL